MRRPGEAWELMFEGADAVLPVAFSTTRTSDEGRERLWLVELPRDARGSRVHEELHEVNSELVNTKRDLTKEKARLVRALDELERELHENERLSQEFQRQNEEMEAQNEELLAMTEELHAGQDQLLQLNHQLERRTRELQIAISARNRFYAAMSHELRTPINAIMGYNDLLLASVYGRLAEQQELAIERSQRAARHLRELVGDILDISRIELGKFDVQPETLELPQAGGGPVRRGAAAGGRAGLHPSPGGRGRALHGGQRPAPRPADRAQPAFQRHQVRGRQAGAGALRRARRRGEWSWRWWTAATGSRRRTWAASSKTSCSWART